MKYLLPLLIFGALIWYGVSRFLKAPKRTTPPVPPYTPVVWPPVDETPIPASTPPIANERRAADEIESLERGFAGGKLPEKDRRASKKPPTT